MTRMTLSRSLLALSLSLATGLCSISHAAAVQSPEAIKQYNQGIQAYTNGENAKALELFQKAVAVDPRYGDAYYNMGSIYFQSRAYPKAEEAFRAALNVNPTDAQAIYNLALTEEKLSKPEEARKLYMSIPATDPKFVKAQQRAAVLEKQIASGNSQAPISTQPVNNPATGTPVAGDPLDNKKLTVETFSKGYFGPTGMTIGPGGYLFVANYSKNLISKVGANGDKATFIQGNGLNGPMGMAFNPKTGDMFVANYLDNNIARIKNTGQVDVIASGLKKPYSLFFDGTNNALYVTEQETNSISRIDLP
ncbi:MAG: tetratricopeptide repeat protein [Candidatus Melainabacteria bacterium]